MTRLMRIWNTTACVALATGCATTIPPDAGADPSDPYERVNRHVAEFNDRLDRNVLKPTAKGYVAVVPESVRICVGNVFSNIGEVPAALNNLLQGKAFDAASDVCRFVINSTVGVAGCFDVASKMGLAKSNEDFGQTLGRWGAGPGAYIVLPLFGPSDVRDAFGRVADMVSDPVSYITPTGASVGASAVRVVDFRSQLLSSERLIDEAALDKYRFIRDAYLQRRRNLVYDGNPPRIKDDDDEPADAKPLKDDEKSRNESQRPDESESMKRKPVKPTGDSTR